MPVSTTHCQVGSIVGCGLVGGKKNIQWNILYGILISWLITLPLQDYQQLVYLAMDIIHLNLIF